MINWDSLLPPQVGQDQNALQGDSGSLKPSEVGHEQSTSAGAAGQSFTPDWDDFGRFVPVCPTEKTRCPTQLGQPKANGGAASSRFVPVVPVVPPKKQGAGSFNDAGAAGRPVELCAENGGRRSSYPLNPAAVVLLLAWCQKAGADNDERLAALNALATLPPGEQVRAWAGQCREQGLNPWPLIHLEAPTEGKDCCQCAHLTSRQIAMDGSRRWFHWGCALGYLLHEYARGSERIWFAPPECRSWERWYPTS